MKDKFDHYLEVLQAHPSLAHHNYKKETILKASRWFENKDGILVCVGCAHGSEVYGFYKEAGFKKAIGITRGQVNLDKANQDYNQYGLKFYIMDMHDLKLKSEKVDYIYASHTLEHAYAPFIAMLELNRVLKDKGRIYAIIPGQEESTNCQTGTIGYHHPNLLNEKQWKQMFKVTGFDILFFDKIYKEDTCVEYSFCLEKNNNNLEDVTKDALNQLMFKLENQ